jgi:hypothetical protein
MSQAITEEVTADDLVIREAAVSGTRPEAQADGRVKIHIMRPCVGRGRGRHLYTAAMLQENAHKFTGWPMYVDHLSTEARKAAGGLPRSLRDIGGWIEESWWDASVPADPERGFGQGAVVATATPFGLAEELIRRSPKIVKTSISTSATGARPTMHDGQRVMLVEGIADTGSVDWVTEAGAGGEVVALMEAAYDDLVEAGNALATLDDEQFQEYLNRERPELVEALTGDAEVEVTDGDDIKNTDDAQGGDDMGVTPEALREALESDEGQALLEAILNEKAPALIEARLDQERTVIRAEAEAIANRRVDLRDMRDAAHAQIEEAKLPASWKDALKAEFDLSESGEPTASLDVVEDYDDEGTTIKSAKVALRESVAARIKSQKTLLQEARPTRVSGLGPNKAVALEEGAKVEKEQGTRKPGEGTLYGSLLQEANVDPSTAWDRL